MKHIKKSSDPNPLLCRAEREKMKFLHIDENSPSVNINM